VKTLNQKLPAEQAAKELKQFSIASLASSIIGLVAFWWLGFAGIGLGVRAIILSRHEGNKGASAKKYFVIALVGALVGAADLILYHL
jgi:hypothetical protein